MLLGIYVDGILTDEFVHTTILENETDNKLSLSVINSDTISGLSFFSGAFPAKYGEKTAAVLNLETRDGNRIKPSGRVSTGVLTTGGVVDGPFANNNGSWLFAGRTSYFDYLQRFVEKITNTEAANRDSQTNAHIDFTDMQTKVVYDLSGRNQIGVSAIYGLFLGADPASPDRIDPNDLHKIDSRNLLVNAHWTYSPNAQLLAQTRVFTLETNSTTGRYYQFPDLRQLFGYLGNPNLRAEQATHYNVSVERMLGDRTRILAEVYDREDKDQIFSLSEPRIQASNITLEGFPFQNSLRGYARGVELSLQRRSANGLTGWVSYAYSRTQLKDLLDNLTFVSDFDQRHTINMYGNYRLTATFNLSAQWRYGSGLPWRGLLEPFGSGFTVGSYRNTARLPYYSRVDLRANKAFLFRKWKLTLSGEVLNVQNRKNLFDIRSDPVRIKSRGRAFYGLTDLMPILPSIGVAFDF